MLLPGQLDLFSRSEPSFIFSSHTFLINELLQFSFFLLESILGIREEKDGFLAYLSVKALIFVLTKKKRGDFK